MRVTSPLVAAAAVLGLAVAACTDVSGSDPADPAPAATEPGPEPAPDDEPPAEPDAAGPDDAEPDSELTALLVSGIFDSGGTELLELTSAVVVPGEARQPLETTRGIFLVEVTYTDGTTSTVPFDALIASGSDVGAGEHGYFEVAVQLEGDIATIRILGAGDGDATTFVEIPADAVTR